MIEARGVITLEDYIRSQRLHLRPRPVFRVIGVILLGLFLIAFFASAREALTAGRFTGLLPLFGAMSLYFPFLYFVWLPFSARRTYNQQKTLHVPLTLRMDSKGLGIESELGSSTLPWNLLHRWKENRHLFLVYHAGNVFTPVPKRLLSSEESLSVRALLSSHLKRVN